MPRPLRWRSFPARAFALVWVRFQVCAPSLGMMGFDADECVVPVDVCGVAAMYEAALKAWTAYFIS